MDDDAGTTTYTYVERKNPPTCPSKKIFPHSFFWPKTAICRASEVFVGRSYYTASECRFPQYPIGPHIDFFAFK